VNLRQARAIAAEYGVTKLLGTKNAKTIKGEKRGWSTAILYLIPSDLSGVTNVCAFASKGCREACLNTAGRGHMASVQEARLRKTVFWKHDPEAFITMLGWEIQSYHLRAFKKGMHLAVRLNGTSDIWWEKEAPQLFELNYGVQFYDYTKNRARFLKSNRTPPNYDLTFSRAEDNDKQVRQVVRAGGRVAVVFEPPLPKKWRGRDVVPGDDDDLRFLDRSDIVVGLEAKGKAIRDTSGFVIRQPVVERVRVVTQETVT